VFSTISDINVRMISQGASEISITFVVEEDDVTEAVRRLHETFFSELDPSVYVTFSGDGTPTLQPRCSPYWL